MALVDQIHALATKCAQMDKDLDTRLSNINVDTLEKPYTDYKPSLSDIDIAKLQDGAIVVTDDPISDSSNAVLAEVEQSLSSGKNTVPSSYAVKEAIDEVAKQSGSGRNIGEVFYSLIPLVDATVHLLNGGLIYQEGIYKNFVNYMVGLYEDGQHDNLFVTEAEFQQSITTYGVCGKFVWDSVNKTLRLPKVTGFIQGTVVESAIGDLVEAGLPNITGTTGILSSYVTDSTSSGAFRWNKTDVGRIWDSYNNDNGYFTFDASLHNLIYGNSNTVQPQAIKGYVYIVLANAVKTQIEVDIDDVATELNGKADASDVVTLDGSNLTGAAVKTVVETWESPDHRSWYRKYSDGWVVQGGNTVTNGGATVITWPVPFRDTTYLLIGGTLTNFNGALNARATYVGYDKTVTGFTTYTDNVGNQYGQEKDWLAMGYAAS